MFDTRLHITLHCGGGQDPLHLHCHDRQTLAQAIWLSGLAPPPPLCSGLGRCGRCRVRFVSAPPEALDAEKTLLSPEELREGWRLACRHRAEALPRDMVLELPPAPPTSTRKDTAVTTAQPLVLAVDLGTTSLHWRVLAPDGAHGTVIASGQELNPQMGAGSDVMSRLAAARHPGGGAVLARLVRDRLAALVADYPDITQICLAANTAMTAIFLERDISVLASAPYSLPLTGHSLEQIAGLPPVYVPPQPAPFVGGDISAGMAVLLEKPAPFLLADLGTNGEFVLHVGPGQTWITSVPMGPALEGIGLTFGDLATSGAGIVNAVTLTPAGLHPHTLDNQPPRRLCAAGYLSLMRVLLQTGILREDGTFCTDPALPLARKVAARLYRAHSRTMLPLFGNIYLTAEDAEEILKVKAAFSLALESLLHAAHMPATALQRVYLAGALGEHVPAEDLEILGFVPPGMSRRLEAPGNTALQGAQLLALHPPQRNRLAQWSQSCRLVSLAESPHFTENYLRHMRFGQPLPQ